MILCFNISRSCLPSSVRKRKHMGRVWIYKNSSAENCSEYSRWKACFRILSFGCQVACSKATWSTYVWRKENNNDVWFCPKVCKDRLTIETLINPLTVTWYVWVNNHNILHNLYTLKFLQCGSEKKSIKNDCFDY